MRGPPGEGLQGGKTFSGVFRIRRNVSKPPPPKAGAHHLKGRKDRFKGRRATERRASIMSGVLTTVSALSGPGPGMIILFLKAILAGKAL